MANGMCVVKEVRQRMYLFCDFFSAGYERGGSALARVVRLDDGPAVADAVVRHQWRHREQSVT
jgi:hypothetical protein